METLTQNIYEFFELPESSRITVINFTIDYFMECFDYDDLSNEMKKAVDVSEEMQTPWFLGEYIWDYANAEVLTECQRALYFIDGSFAKLKEE
jgi:hypothetical protein